MSGNSPLDQDGGWIAWAGGDPPIPQGTRHFAKYRDGGVAPQTGEKWSAKVWAFYWQHSHNSPDDIVAYRVLADQPGAA